jgi:hypothetical protein
MIDVQILNTPAIVRHYMLANTPRYLYRNLRAESSVATLADSAGPQELLAAVNAIEDNPNRRVEDVAVAYAMLVAMSLQDYRLATEALAQWEPKALAWAKEITAILTHNNVVTRTVELPCRGAQIMGASNLIDIPFTVQELS